MNSREAELTGLPGPAAGGLTVRRASNRQPRRPRKTDKSCKCWHLTIRQRDYTFAAAVVATSRRELELRARTPTPTVARAMRSATHFKDIRGAERERAGTAGGGLRDARQWLVLQEVSEDDSVCSGPRTRSAPRGSDASQGTNSTELT